MIKLKEPYMVYDDEKDIVHIYDGKAEVVCIEHPLINLDYLAQSLGCVIENNVSITEKREIVKIAPSGVCETSEPVAEWDGIILCGIDLLVKIIKLQMCLWIRMGNLLCLMLEIQKAKW